MKTTAVVESLSYYKTNVLFQRIPAYLKTSRHGVQPDHQKLHALTEMPLPMYKRIW